MTANHNIGTVMRIAGPVVAAVGLHQVRLFDVLHVGEMGLIGEAIRLAGDVTTIQIYEDTSGLRVGEPVANTGTPLVAALRPGLLGQVYDGLQRPLTTSHTYLQRGQSASPLSISKKWQFTPQVTSGQQVRAGDVLGTVPESQTIEHRVMVPPGVNEQTLARLADADVVIYIGCGERGNEMAEVLADFPTERLKRIPQTILEQHDV